MSSPSEWLGEGEVVFPTVQSLQVHLCDSFTGLVQIPQELQGAVLSTKALKPLAVIDCIKCAQATINLCGNSRRRTEAISKSLAAHSRDRVGDREPTKHVKPAAGNDGTGV